VITPAATFCATLVDTWVACGVRHACIAPGSRSTPMALAIAARSDLAVHIFHDERSASFAALGLGRATGTPALLLCTSGTAAAQFHAAVIEAHQDDVPLIVMTADRPPELRGVAAPQTIDQTHLFGHSVRWFADPGVPDSASAHTWRPLARRAWDASTGTWSGPVHINLPFRDPLVGEPGPLPAAAEQLAVVPRRSLDRADLAAVAARLDAHRGVVVAGRGSAAAVLDLAESLGWPVLADQRSGIGVDHPNVIEAFDEVLRHPRFAADHTPTVVLHVGMPISSKVTNAFLAGSGAFHIQLQSSGGWIDPDYTISARIVGDVDVIAHSLIGTATGATNTPWLARWRRAGERAGLAIDQIVDGDPGLNEPKISRDLLAALPDGSALVVSSSMPIRDMESYGRPRHGVETHANRGANGIDGVTSTAVGVALADLTRPVTLLIGDVAFLHDTNGLLGLAGRPVRLTIVVIDNDGGGIFSFLPQRDAVGDERFEQLWGTPHGVDIPALSRAHGIPVETIESSAELISSLSSPPSSGARLLYLRTNRAENVAIHHAIHDAVRRVLDQR
jgi:2-succinyl-5-enolpyruvyl-6-hydroxy-3-cyclohexene-1-carboxylate synthase